MKQLPKLSVAMVALFTMVILMLPSCDKILDNPDNSNLNKGDTAWIYEIPEAEELYIPDAFMAIGTNGDIYFEVRDVNAVDNPRVYAITKDGKFKWKTEPFDDNGLNYDKMLNSAIVVADDGTLYCTSGPFLYSINPSNGQAKKIWECPKTITIDDTDFEAYSSLVNLCLANDGNLVVQSYGLLWRAAALFCITPDGQLKWMDVRKDPNALKMSIGPDGNIYDIADLWDNSVQAWVEYMLVTDPDNGNLLLEQRAFPTNTFYPRPVFTSNGDVIFPLKQIENTLVRMETNDSNSNIIWRLKNYRFGYAYSVVDKNDNTFSYFTESYDGIFIPSITTGDITSPENIYIPKYPNIDTKGNLTGGQSDAFANIVSSDKTGKVLWKYDKMGTNCSSVTLSNDNVLYFSSFYDTETSKNRNRIFAIKWDASLEHSGWPRYTHDNRNTSNYNKW